jgi:hypothetical protein
MGAPSQRREHFRRPGELEEAEGKDESAEGAEAGDVAVQDEVVAVLNPAEEGKPAVQDEVIVVLNPAEEGKPAMQDEVVRCATCPRRGRGRSRRERGGERPA